MPDDIKIIFEDDYLLLIDKPAGIVVNRADSVKDKTIQDWVEENNIFSRSINLSDDYISKSGIVHRLDKETSGLLLIAKKQESFEFLLGLFRERKISKKYKCLVHRFVIPEKGTINAAVGRLPWNRERFGILPGGREASTDYQVISLYERGTETFSLLDVTPLTGRTHQIRIHLKYLNHPIVSDSFYVGRKQLRKDLQFCPRLFLHAYALKFIHPVTNVEMKWEITMPEDLNIALSTLILKS